MGTTDEGVAAEKAANAQVLADATSQVAASSEAKRDAIEQQYQARKNELEHLAKYPTQYGFTSEQAKGMQHPRVVFVPDAAMPYTADTFAKFNQ